MRAALIATALAASAASSLANADPQSATGEQAAHVHEPPLIAYASEISEARYAATHLSQAELSALHTATTNLRTVTYEMARHPPPPDEECAHTLGARLFAGQYTEIAVTQEQLGNFEAAIKASTSALACEPRVAYHEASIASANLSLARIDEARAAAERGYALNPDDLGIRDVRTRLDFIQERWADATARFRLQALDRNDLRAADYARCYLWLAQRRAGVRDPELPPRQSDEEDKTTRWPVQILEALRGELSEADLAQAIRDDAGNAATEWLTEALFYVGELRLAEGDAETARRHFASVVNLKVLNFVEYGMARAELAKMRERVAAGTRP